jgi:hypothetical protein
MLTFTAPAPPLLPDTTHAGVLCDRGASDAGTVLDGVAIHGFGHDLLAASYAGVAGCNLVLTSSTLSSAQTGVWAPGTCGPSPSIELRVGGSDAGDAIHDVRSPAPNQFGAGLLLGPCVHRVEVDNVMIDDSDYGIDIQGTTTAPSTTVVVTDSTFSALAGAGLRMSGPAVLESLTGSMFTGVSASSALTVDRSALAVGVLLQRDPSDGVTLPRVLRARNNQFVTNDVAVELTTGTLDTAIDFGTSPDPGGNVFRCNSAPQVWAVPSGDIRVFAGAGPDVDTSNATAAPAQCPVGRVP